MSDSVQPHRWKPTRLLHPWDSPGKNTGLGCHFLLQYMKVKSENKVAQLCPTLSDPMDCGAFQAPPSMGFSRQEYWSGMPLPSPSTLYGSPYLVFTITLSDENFYVLSILILRRQWHPTPVLLPGKSHGWRSLVGCSPWGR